MKSLLFTTGNERATLVPAVVPTRRSLVSSLVLFTLILHGFVSGRPAFGAPPASAPRASAAGIAGKDAQLNGARLIPGATIFAGDVVETGAATSAALQFGNDLVLVAPSTQLAVESGAVNLRSGQVQVRLNGADSFAVSGPFFHVNLSSSGGVPGSAEIRVGAARAQIAAVSGMANLTAAGSDMAYRLHSGEVVTLDESARDASGAQTGSVPAAGQVTRLIPDVQIGRASLQTVAAASAPVYWNDDLSSGPTGRARVTLTDGSILNLGSNSELRVVQHDAQAQQTSLELAVGRMRGQVLKLSRPGGKFEVRTPVGVAGLVGTDFYLLVTQDFTELMVFDGAVSFTGFSSGQAVTVTSGMKLLVSRLGVIQGPTPASPQEMQEAKDSTDVAQVVAQNRRSGPPVVPIIISVAAPLAVTGIGLGLSARQSMSQYTPQ